MKSLFKWLNHLVRAPRRVGSVTPSSLWLADQVARRIAEYVARHPDVHLIEVGAGTGAITQALIKVVDPKCITLVEADPECCRQLRRRFPNTQILEGLVENLIGQLVRPGETLVLISSVPLFSLSHEQRGHILTAYETIVSSAGQCRMVQFTYMPWLPGRQAQALCGREVGSVWRNLPPAWVWSATHRSQESVPV